LQLKPDPKAAYVTLFEYLTAGHVLILSFAAVRILNVLPHAVRPSCQYWVHLSWLSLAIGLCIVSFWGFWLYREIEWTLPVFLGALVPTALIYMYSSLLAPPDPSAVESWRDHFYAVRIQLFATGFLLMCAILYSNWAILDLSPLEPGTIQPLVVIFAMGLVSAKPKLQNALALAPPAMVVMTIIIAARPDWASLQ
jgi:hypothetical protein